MEPMAIENSSTRESLGEKLFDQRTPKVLITTSRFNCPSTIGPLFVKHLISLIPNTHYYERGTMQLRKIVQYATEKDFTNMIVVNNTRHGPNAILILGLPGGPTTHFKLSNPQIRLGFKNVGKPTIFKPELVLTNFTTPLEQQVGRVILSLFPQGSESPCDRVVTFDNQNDFIVFRHEHYIYETKKGKQTESKGEKSKDEKNSQERAIVDVLEVGPRFKLKLISHFRGINKPDADTSRRRRGWDLSLEFQGLQI